MRRASLVLLLAIAPACQVVIAQSPGAQVKSIEAVQVDEPPVIDGVIEEKVWTRAAIVDDLHQVNPVEYDPPSEQTRFYVLHTRDALYIAVRAWDSEPGRVVAQSLQQGNYSPGEDSVTVMIDPFNNQRSGYAFDLTAAGVRNQAVYSNVTDENWDWYGIWHGAARLDDRGWTAEIEIPFKTVSFKADNDTWGLNLARWVGRKTEYIGWVSANRTQNPAVSGTMAGLRGMEQGLGLDVVPGMKLSTAKDFQNGDSANDFEPTLDVFYRFTPALTGALTFNTDFSGTGADARQVNLTRFGLFFPEQRAFFLRDTDIFDFGRINSGDYNDNTTLSAVERESGRPFFSRKIGLTDDGDTVPINYGGKLTGRAGPWDIGMLAVQQDDFGKLDSSDLFVGRVARSVLRESSIGAILTHGDPGSNADNSLAGVDFRYLNTGLPGGRTLEGAAWYQQSHTDGLGDDDAAFGASLSLPSATGLRGRIAFKELQANFNPALGFVNRVDVRDYSAEAGYTIVLKDFGIREIYSGVDWQRIDTLDGERQSEYLAIRPLELTLPASDSLQLQYLRYRENLIEPFEITNGISIPEGDYSFGQYCLNGSTAAHRKLGGGAFYCDGDFYDGTQYSAGGHLTWRPSPHFKLEARYDYYVTRLPQGHFVTRLASLRAGIGFSNTLYWDNFLQYDNDSDSLGLNSILRWIPRAGRELVLVVNREYIDATESLEFRSVTRDMTLKVSYTLRF